MTLRSAGWAPRSSDAQRRLGGWQAFRMIDDDWSIEINLCWINGAVDAGKPVLVSTPFNQIREGSVTMQELWQAFYRGGNVVAGR